MKDRTFLDGFAKIRNFEFCVCTQVPEYGRQKKLFFGFFTIKKTLLNEIIGFESGVKKIDFSWRY